MRPRKFKRDEVPISSVAQLDRYIMEGRWIYLHYTPKHPSLFNNMTLSTLRYLIHSHALALAIPINRENL